MKHSPKPFLNKFAITIAAWSVFAGCLKVHGDAIVVTKAMTASTIAEFFIDVNEVRVELEIGARDLEAFRNLLPDSVYQQMFDDSPSSAKRIEIFFQQDLVIRDENGMPVAGSIVELEARKRIIRDEVTGKPLAIQPTSAEPVVYAVLSYPIQGQPQSLTLCPPVNASGNTAASIGFVSYHRDLPITEFRYLAANEKVVLNWRDPRYSRFENQNLKRQYDSPVSVFLYVEPFEVRKEIIIRPVDLQRWLDLDIDIDGTIPIASQPMLKERIAQFLKTHHPVRIDGQPAVGELDRIHFVNRSLRKTGVVYPDQDLAAVSATLGLIFIYPIDELPQKVTLEWELFDNLITEVPAVATDEAGGMPARLSASDPTLVWTNFLKNPTIPAMKSVPPPPAISARSIPALSLIFSLLLVLILWRAFSKNEFATGTLVFAVACLVMVFLSRSWWNVPVPNPWNDSRNVLSQSESDQVVNSLLHNLYHAFDHRQEKLVYDQLSHSISGDLLRDVYLQTRKQIQLADQGGTQIRIDQVELLENDLRPGVSGIIDCRCKWSATGTVGHWGHLHQRRLGHEADFTIQPVDGSWKITSMQVIDQTEPEILESTSN